MHTHRKMDYDAWMKFVCVGGGGGFIPIDVASFNTIVCVHLSIVCVNLWTSVTFSPVVFYLYYWCFTQCQGISAHIHLQSFCRETAGMKGTRFHPCHNGQRLIQFSNSRKFVSQFPVSFRLDFLELECVRESDT